MPRPRALYLDKWDSGQRNQPSPVRDRLVDLVERRPGISQAEAGRILNRNVSLTVKAAVAGGLLRRQSREDRIDSWLLFPQEEWQPTDPRNPAERPNRQLWVLELMGRAGRELTVREVLARARKRVGAQCADRQVPAGLGVVFIPSPSSAAAPRL